jgi:hypothetical protein
VPEFIPDRYTSYNDVTFLRPHFDGESHHVSQRAADAYVQNIKGDKLDVIDPYAVAYWRQGYNDKVMDAHSNLAFVMKPESNESHEEREHTLDEMARGSHDLHQQITDHTILVRTNQIVNGVLSLGLSHLAGIEVPSTTSASKALRGIAIANIVTKFNDRKHPFLMNASVARSYRQGSAELRNACGDENVFELLKNVMNDVDIRATDYMDAIIRMPNDSADSAYIASGVPRASSKLYFSRDEEVAIKTSLLC